MNRKSPFVLRMSKKLTQEEFIRRAREVHGDKYDYSKVEYRNYDTKVCIICPEHGAFLKRAGMHLRGQGCPRCCIRGVTSKKLGGRTTDLKGVTGTQFHNQWLSMMARCYSPYFLSKQQTYIGCSVCEEWKKLSKFKMWFDEHYVEGWQLDKDILVKGNKEYGPNTCCFVPSEINQIFKKTRNKNKSLPIGVSRKKDKFIATISIKGHTQSLGIFDSPQMAYEAYKKAKEQYIKILADKYKDKLEPRVYDCLCNYRFE